MATVPTGYIFWDASANKSYAAGTTYPTLGNGDYLVPATTSYDGYYHQYIYYTSYTDNWSGLSITNGWVGTVQSSYVSKAQKLPFNSINGKPVVIFSYDNCTFTSCPTTTGSGSTSSLISNNTNLKHIRFYKCANMTSAPQLPTSLLSIDYGFFNTKITSAPSNFSNLTNLISANYCFYGVNTLTTMPNISSLSALISAEYMFYGTAITSVTSLPPNLELATGMFKSCTNVSSPPILPSTLTNMSQMFRGCTSLTSAPTIPSMVGDIDRAFYGCTSLEGFIRVESHIIGSSSESFYNTSSSKKIILLKTIVSGTSNQSKLKQIVNIGSNNNNVYAGIVARISSFTAIRGNYDSSSNTFVESVNGTYCKLTVDYNSVNITGALLKPPTLTDSNGNSVSVTWKIGTLAGQTLNSSGSQIQDSGTIVSVINLGSSETTETYTIKMNSSCVYNSVTYEWVSGEKNATLTYSNVIFDVNPTGTATGYHMEAPDDENGHFFKDDVYIDGKLETTGNITDGHGFSIPFIATKDVTTYNEVTEALATGKTIFAKEIDQDIPKLYTYILMASGNRYWFGRIQANTAVSGRLFIVCNDDDTWDKYEQTQTDFIIESGTNNSWLYRKWHGGTYEAWRTITLSIARQTSYGSLYRSLEQSVTLPSFNSGTNYQLIGSSNGGDWLLFNTFNETTASYFFIRTSSAAAANKVARLYIHGTYS